jgi:hypothetical protein
MIYELRKTGAGHELAGGQLTEPLKYEGPDAIEYAARMVGFLSQVTGGEMDIIDAGSVVVETRAFRVCMWPKGDTLGNFQDDGALHASTTAQT